MNQEITFFDIQAFFIIVFLKKADIPSCNTDFFVSYSSFLPDFKCPHKNERRGSIL